MLSTNKARLMGAELSANALAMGGRCPPDSREGGVSFCSGTLRMTFKWQTLDTAQYSLIGSAVRHRMPHCQRNLWWPVGQHATLLGQRSLHCHVRRVHWR
ncbi:hypothetical protein LSM04_006838 [Trypanosoma melophagium]|uniref:uncharacterized protein n=1 Tax=Trypanosoma melophagium TaxID=715481 RepID=UPI00351A25B5|nr:hypothetical protein LSM04_006838 [Trypanosoma melophagium]